MARNTYVVKKATPSKWEVLREGDRRPSASKKTKTEAIKTARTLTRQAGGGEVVVLGRAGKVSNVDEVRRPARASGGSAAKTARTTAASSGRRAMRSLRTRLAR